MSTEGAAPPPPMTDTKLQAMIVFHEEDRKEATSLARTHLAVIKQRTQGFNVILDDVLAGDNLTLAPQRLQEALRDIQIILVLVSQHLLADHGAKIELLASAARGAEDRIYLIPVLLRQSDWRRTPLAPFSPIPAHGRACKSSKKDTAERFWTSVREAVHGLVDFLSAGGDRQNAILPGTLRGAASAPAEEPGLSARPRKAAPDAAVQDARALILSADPAVRTALYLTAFLGPLPVGDWEFLLRELGPESPLSTRWREDNVALAQKAGLRSSVLQGRRVIGLASDALRDALQAELPGLDFGIHERYLSPSAGALCVRLLYASGRELSDSVIRHLVAILAEDQSMWSMRWLLELLDAAKAPIAMLRAELLVRSLWTAAPLRPLLEAALARALQRGPLDALLRLLNALAHQVAFDELRWLRRMLDEGPPPVRRLAERRLVRRLRADPQGIMLRALLDLAATTGPQSAEAAADALTTLVLWFLLDQDEGLNQLPLDAAVTERLIALALPRLVQPPLPLLYRGLVVSGALFDEPELEELKTPRMEAEVPRDDLALTGALLLLRGATLASAEVRAALQRAVLGHGGRAGRTATIKALAQLGDFARVARAVLQEQTSEDRAERAALAQAAAHLRTEQQRIRALVDELNARPSY